MVRISRLGLTLVALLLAAYAVSAASWTGGRGTGNRGTFPDAVFPTGPAVVWKAYLGRDFVGAQVSNTVVCGKVVSFAYGRFLFGFDTATGEYLWHTELPDLPLGDLLMLEDQIIISHANGDVVARKPADGSVLWKHSFSGGMRNPPTQNDDFLFLNTKTGSMEGIDWRTGKYLGATKVGNKIEAGPVLFGKSIILCFPDGNISRIDNGVAKWNVTLPNSLVSISPVTDGRSTVLVNTTNTIYALNPGDRNTPIRWFQFVADRMPEPVTLDGTRVYVATRSGKMLCMDLMTGRHLWGKKVINIVDGKSTEKIDPGVPLAAPPVGSPIVVGKHLMVRMQQGLLALYDKTTGRLEWMYRIKPPLGAPAPADAYVGAPAIDGDDIYFAGSDGHLYHLSASAVDIEPPLFSGVSPVIADKGFVDPTKVQFLGALIDDEGTGLRPQGITLRLDNTDLTATLQYDARTGYHYVPVTPQLLLEPGMHRLVMTAKDFRDNQGTLALNFIVGAKETGEQVPVTISGEFLPKRLRVKPGTIVSWTNKSGSPRTVVADTGEFSSDAQYPEGIPNGETWVWIVPADMDLDTLIFYHCRLQGKPGDGEQYGTGLVGLLEVNEPEPVVAPLDGPPPPGMEVGGDALPPPPLPF